MAYNSWAMMSRCLVGGVLWFGRQDKWLYIEERPHFMGHPRWTKPSTDKTVLSVHDFFCNVHQLLILPCRCCATRTVSSGRHFVLSS